MLSGPAPVRQTKIVATIGPASEEKAPLEACVAAGMNIMRVNFSHATVEEFHLRRNNLRNNPAGENVAVMLDTKGPEIRMGGLKVCKESGDRKAKISLVAGETLTLTTDPAYNGASDDKTLYIDYARIGEVVSKGDNVLLDDGLVSLKVVEVVSSGTDGGTALITTEIVNSSEIGERKGVNLPGVKTGLPAMSEKDKTDIKFGVQVKPKQAASSSSSSSTAVAPLPPPSLTHTLPFPLCCTARHRHGRRLLCTLRRGRARDPRLLESVPRRGGAERPHACGRASPTHHLED